MPPVVSSSSAVAVQCSHGNSQCGVTQDGGSGHANKAASGGDYGGTGLRWIEVDVEPKKAFEFAAAPASARTAHSAENADACG